MAGALDGLKIVEMAGLGPCPLAGQLLADLGAEVIVIERAAGGPRADDVNNRNKQSVAINLKSPEGLAAALALIDRADVLIEGFRPGVMERLGIGPEAVRGRNQGLIYGRMTGWGQEGPLARTAGHDINYLSLTGALHMMGQADAPPPPPLNLVADYAGGTMFLIFGVLAALWERGRSGRGQVVDAAMVDGVAALSGAFRTLAARGEWTAARESNLLDGGAPFYRTYETQDGRFVSVGAIEPQFFAEMVAGAGIAAGDASRQNDATFWPAQRTRYAAIFHSKTRAEWEEIFQGSDACVAPVLTMDEAAGHSHNVARAIYSEVGGMIQAMPAPRFDRTPAPPPRQAVAAGTDTRAVLAAVGLSDAEIARLEGQGAIFSADPAATRSSESRPSFDGTAAWHTTHPEEG